MKLFFGLLLLQSFSKLEKEFKVGSLYLKGKFFTEVNEISIDQEAKLNHSQSMVFLGSCFSENIFNELKSLKFSVYQNPQGTIFNPISISNCLMNIIQAKNFTTEDIFIDRNRVNDEIFHSWHHNTQYSSMNKDEMLERMNNDMSEAHRFLTNASVLFITLGTAKIFSLKQTNENPNTGKEVVVANCHQRKYIDHD
jgi:hypothetical protein